jgi:methionyl aminopeptidase
MERNDPCFCGSGKKWKKCHYPQLPAGMKRSELQTRYLKQYGIILKNAQQIDGIRKACQLTKHILEETAKQVKAGVTTNELNTFAHKMCLDAGAIPATLGYGHPPYPKSICTSLNDVICHGIPDNKPLKEGDILNIDFSCILNGFYGDCSRMVAIGQIDAEKKKVIDVSYECLMRSIAILKPGILLLEIGEVIESYASKHGCSVVSQFVAHGIGIEFHEEPQIPHHYNTLKIPLAPGMTFTIEPMINAGLRDVVIDEKDGWTARTPDGKPSAQWEHTILITETGHEILTLEVNKF